MTNSISDLKTELYLLREKWKMGEMKGILHEMCLFLARSFRHGWGCLLAGKTP